MFSRLLLFLDSLNQSKLSCKTDTTLKKIATSIDRFGEVVVESKPCEFTFVRSKDKQAQMMVADDFFFFYVYYSYTSFTSASRWYSNVIVIFNINCIIGIESCFIFTYLD
jgi:hypothetical protein